jgi:branched-chain amino acid aminotransferase
LPHLSPDFRLTVSERPISLEELVQASQEGKILEAFGTGTAAVLCPVKRFVPALSLRHIHAY